MPLLFGHGAGGQAALWLLAQNGRAKFGGFILSATAPFDIVNRRALPQPNPAEVKDCPFFVLTGEGDAGNPNLWKQVEPVWRRANVPMTVRYVKGKGHEWLLGASETSLLDKWLEQLAAGTIPEKRPMARHPEPATRKKMMATVWFPNKPFPR